MMAWGYGMDAGAWIWMFVWIIGLVAMVWLIVRGDRHGPAEDPDTILRERFARGEISADELERARLVLKHDSGSKP